MKLTPEELDLLADILAVALWNASGDEAEDIKALLSRIKDYEAQWAKPREVLDADAEVKP